jgi:hypothetical protein
MLRYSYLIAVTVLADPEAKDQVTCSQHLADAPKTHHMEGIRTSLYVRYLTVWIHKPCQTENISLVQQKLK